MPIFLIDRVPVFPTASTVVGNTSVLENDLRLGSTDFCPHSSIGTNSSSPSFIHNSEDNNSDLHDGGSTAFTNSSKQSQIVDCLSGVSPSTPSFSSISSIPDKTTTSPDDLQKQDNCDPASAFINLNHNVPTDNDVLEDEANVEPVMGFKMIGDNIDKNVKCRYTRVDKRQVTSMHYYHYYALQDRTNIAGIPDNSPDLENIPLLTIPVNDVLPTVTDERNLYHNFAIIISRVLVDNLKYFNCYSDVVTHHIKHDFYDEMSSKSETVSLIFTCICNCMIKIPALQSLGTFRSYTKKRI